MLLVVVCTDDVEVVDNSVTVGPLQCQTYTTTFVNSLGSVRQCSTNSLYMIK